MNNSTTLQLNYSIPPETTLERDVTLGFFLVTFIIGSIGNILVIIIVVKKRTKRTANDIFIMSLAVSDLTLILFLPLQIIDLFGKLPFNVFTCNFVRPLMTVTFFVSIFTLTAMAVYRCKVILNPFRPEMKELTAVVLVVLLWISSFIIVLPFMIVSKPLENFCLEDWPTRTHQQAYTVALVLLQYILPLFVIAIAYIRIGLDLYRARLPRRMSFKRRSSAKEVGAAKINYKARKRENQQVIKTLATIVIMFAVCLLPGQVIWLVMDFGSEKQKKSLQIWMRISVISSVFNSCLNPLVYGTLTRQFRRGYIKYLSYLLCCCQSNSTVKRLQLMREDTSKTDSRKRPSFHLIDKSPFTTSTSISKKKSNGFRSYLKLGTNGSTENGCSRGPNVIGEKDETIV
ncbi:neuropeptide FF receptor 2-like [Actinia tenebrosa]|uniref:Neuropeptide FF receptor 2-like n=1 Tax=Actinia tenebrosa TaxID=6105 RepID=A0A6P8H9Q4_ACTTE|nr:neuropeptide FF receptor 2-like [Actinia tenebrosa]XP_031553176.1 neuropeptide FF receptor 2-like [Actinia tenebrosa]